jgi:RimJ/RimL family protein N-acetyltransferase
METITLEKMTKELCLALYRNWENDASVCRDMARFKPYLFDETKVCRYWESKQEASRILFAIMLSDKPIGELQLKQIDRERGECTLSIHMQNDTVKGRGYGTQAEIAAVKYAFDTLGLTAVNADALIKNTRSQHVLEKVGFKFIKEEGSFRYYRIERSEK